VAAFDAGSVLLAYVHSNEVAHSWHLSMVDLLGWDLAHERRVMRGGFHAMRCGTGGIVQARNDVAAQFVEKSDAEWLFWIDTDMGFGPSTVDRLVEAADADERPVVGGLCFAQREYESDGLGGFRVRPMPTIYRWAEMAPGVSGFSAWEDYPRDQVVRADGTGSACILIHRSVVERVLTEYDTCYGRMSNPGTGQLLSEDLSFCARLVMLDIPLHVDTSVKTTHLKPQWVAEADFLRSGNAAGMGWQGEWMAAMR
jgi:hypothetical protein